MAKTQNVEVETEEQTEEQSSGRGRPSAPTNAQEALTYAARRLTAIVRQIEGLKNQVRYCAKLGVSQKRVLAIEGHLVKAAANFKATAEQIYAAPDEVAVEEIIDL